MSRTVIGAAVSVPALAPRVVVLHRILEPERFLSRAGEAVRYWGDLQPIARLEDIGDLLEPNRSLGGPWR